MPDEPSSLAHLPLAAWHEAQGARFTPFAGTAMPLVYGQGVIAEHHHCRSQAALFDVSHMGVIKVSPFAAAERVEMLTPGDLSGLAVGRQRYILRTNAQGGVEDDLLAFNDGHDLFLIANATRKAEDLAAVRSLLTPGQEARLLSGRVLLALQGPAARAVLAEIFPEAQAMRFMSAAWVQFAGQAILLCCSGYTGEDGFEILLPEAVAAQCVERLCAHSCVRPAGLGARDSLRLEAALCLYGQDLTPEISPVEADLGFALSKRRLKAGDFLGAPTIIAHHEKGAPRRRCGLVPQGRQPVRAGAQIVDAEGARLGEVTSGLFSPSLKHPIAMALLAAHVTPQTELYAQVRGRLLACTLTPLPFWRKRSGGPS